MFRLSLPQLLFGCLLSMALLAAGPVGAVPPSDVLLPETTRGVITLTDLERLKQDWEKTQWGRLINDPVMQPFAESIKQQVRDRWTHVEEKLGLTLDDLQGVAAGEVALALIQPKPGRAAVALMADVTGREDEARKLLTKLDVKLSERGTKKEVEVLGTKVVVYTIPPVGIRTKPATSVFCLHEQLMCATDSVAELEGILARYETGSGGLHQAEVYQAVVARSAAHSGDAQPHIRWFVAPLSFAQTFRDAHPERLRPKGKDLIEILSNQGFGAIEGVGGLVTLRASERHDVLHATSIYAPPVEGAKEDERYTMAARMLDFPNGDSLQPRPWVPRGLAMHASFNWKVREAFEYSSTLVDELVGEKGIFEDVIRSIREDPNGPRVDLRADLIGHLGTHCTAISEYELPIGPKSERIVFAIESTNSERLAETVRKVMANDPEAHRRSVGTFEVWEISQEQEELQEPEIEFDPVGAAAPRKPKEPKGLPNSAVCVAYDHLLIASHFDFLTEVLKPLEPRDTLINAFDYKSVAEDLDRLLPPEACGRFFSRGDETVRPTYELVRQGKMPQAETMLARLLNQVLGNGKKGQLRDQQIDGSTLPEFDTVRRYFGPIGAKIVALEDGWIIVGMALSNR